MPTYQARVIRPYWKFELCLMAGKKVRSNLLRTFEDVDGLGIIVQ